MICKNIELFRDILNLSSTCIYVRKTTKPQLHSNSQSSIPRLIPPPLPSQWCVVLYDNKETIFERRLQAARIETLNRLIHQNTDSGCSN